MTILEAAEEVVRSSNKPLSIEDIHNEILRKKLYNFNSDDSLAIVREQVRRHTLIPGRKIQYRPLLFSLTPISEYEIMDNNKLQGVNYRRIRRAKDKEPLIERLTKKSENKFGDIWKLCLFAAALGFSHKKREKVLEYDSGKSIDFSYFGGSPCWPGFMHLIGLITQDSPDILNPDPESVDLRISIFEEYMNGGLSLINSETESRDYSLDALLSLIPKQPLAVQQPGDQI